MHGENTAEDAKTEQIDDRSISLLRANFMMLYFAVPATILPAALWYWVWGLDGIERLFTQSGIRLWMFLALAGGIVVHEALHAFAWARAARLPFSSIRFGFHWKTITPYAHCSIAIRARAYRIGAVTPLLAMGVLPVLLAIATGSAAVLAFGLFFTFAAGGDMLILWLIRDIPSNAMVEDHPTRAGCMIRSLE